MQDTNPLDGADPAHHTAILVRETQRLRDAAVPIADTLTVIGGWAHPHGDTAWVEKMVATVYAANDTIRFVTATEFAAQITDTVHWLAPPWLGAGIITDVVGKIKEAGKTTFVLAMCAAIVKGQPFLEQMTAQSSVIYLTEQAGPSFREALDRAGLIPSDDFVLLQWAETRGEQWPTIVYTAVAEAYRRGAGVLVVDTLPPFAGIIGDDEGKAGAALEAMAPLVTAAAEYELAVVTVRHERKASGSVADAGRGSSAFGGAVDTLLQLVHPAKKGKDAVRDPTVRVVRCLSRFADVEPETFVKYVDGTYEIYDRESGREHEVRNWVRTHPDCMLGDIVEACGRLSHQDVVAFGLSWEGEGTIASPRRYSV